MKPKTFYRIEIETRDNNDRVNFYRDDNSLFSFANKNFQTRLNEAKRSGAKYIEATLCRYCGGSRSNVSYFLRDLREFCE